ncbi:MAG TPA: restriction endonuclease subunit S [Bacteroidia bacterium]|jgi:type I restriction enzyme S subunit|nr:restriction endonuclease subunit S [Bacteroidia bacterium]
MREELLKDIAEVIAGQSPPSDSYNKEGEGTPFFQGMADYGEKFPITRNWCSKPTKISLPNDILISVRAPVGPVNINNIEACIGRGLSAIRVKPNYSYEYLYYFLKANLKQIANLGVGSTFTAITQKELGNIKISVPDSLSDQVKIATVLSKAEALMKQRGESIELLDEFLRSTFLKMFGDPVKNEKNWNQDLLGNTTLKITDGEHLSPKLTQHGFHIVTAKNVLKDKIDFTESNFVSESDYTKFTKKCNPENGDVLLVSRGATIGRCVVVNVDRPFCLMGSVILIKPNKTKLSGSFINYLFKNNSFFRRLIVTSGSSAQQAIYIAGLKKVKTITPPIKLQNQFAAIVDKAEALKEQFGRSQSDLKALYSSLSQRAFKGELDLSAVQIEEKWYNFSGDEPEEKDPVKKAEIKKYFDEQIKKLERGDFDYLDKRYGDPFDVDEKTAKKQGKDFYKEWVKLHKKKPRRRLTWDKVSTQQIAEWTKEKYVNCHFTSEMLVRFLMEEHITVPAYYSSEELKKYPKTNEADDLKNFVFSALNNKNPFIKLKQVFYNAKEKNIRLKLSPEDKELTKDHTPKERSGIYFTIEE